MNKQAYPNSGINPFPLSYSRPHGPMVKVLLGSLLAIIIPFTVAMQNAYGYHETLSVWVNGVRLTPEQVVYLERLYGGQIQSGRYWLDYNTGLWGYEGGPAQGRLPSSAQGSGYQRRVPGGYIGSDGDTSYYYDSESGCSVIPGEGVSC